MCVSLQFARGNLKLSEVLCESQSTVLYRATAEGIRDKPIEVTVKALRGQSTQHATHTLSIFSLSLSLSLSLDLSRHSDGG